MVESTNNMLSPIRGPQTTEEIDNLTPTEVPLSPLETWETHESLGGGEPKLPRAQRRRRERLNKELLTKLNDLLGRFFSYAGKNFDTEAQQKELDRLNTAWSVWLRQNNKKYIYNVCYPMFGNEVKRLLALYTKAAQSVDESKLPSDK